MKITLARRLQGNSGRKRKLSESVRGRRWYAVLIILVAVTVYYLLTEYAFDFTRTPRVISGLLVFGCGGAFLGWYSLIWASRRIAIGEAAKRMALEREKLISSIVSESADAIFSTDLDGVITSWNRGAEYIFGYTSQEMIGNHFSKLVPEDLLQAGEIERLSEEFLSKGYVRNVETERLTRDGRRITVEVTRTALTDDDGRHYRNSAIVRDITERKEAEKQLVESYEKIVEAEQQIRRMNMDLEEKVIRRTANLRQAYQELEKANAELRKANDRLRELDRMKSEFVSMVSHALRAPVTNINGAIELLSQTEGAFDNDEGRDLFEIIQAESARLTRLVQNVLTVSRFEGGRIDLYPESVDMQRLCRRIVQNINATAESHDITLSCPEGLSPVWVDRDCTEEILVNLIDNAIKYSPEGGLIEVKLAEQDGYVEVSVSDHGIGIRESDISKIFDSFYRVDGSDRVTVSGYGLGLYAAKHMVEAQGGTIEVKSILGRGSEFTFSVPVERKR